MKTAVVFDADGVVVRSEFFTVALERIYGISSSSFSSFFEGKFIDCILGKADLRNEIRLTLTNTTWNKTVDEFLEFWFETENQVDQELLNTISNIRSEELGTFLGTNQEKHRMRFMKHKMNLGKYFDGFFPSCEVGQKKPESEYFRLVQESLSNRGFSRIVFFDDSLENVKAAISEGWEAYRYNTIEDLNHWIKSYREPVAGGDATR